MTRNEQLAALAQISTAMACNRFNLQYVSNHPNRVFVTPNGITTRDFSDIKCRAFWGGYQAAEKETPAKKQLVKANIKANEKHKKQKAKSSQVANIRHDQFIERLLQELEGNSCKQQD